MTSVVPPAGAGAPVTGVKVAPLMKHGEIKDLHDVLDIAMKVHNEWRALPWWRGQPEPKPLIAGVFRLNPSKFPPTFEQNLALQFMSRAPMRHANCPAHRDYAAWLFLMQHYRVPTRLLDWTESALFATFFAVEDKSSPVGELWVLNPVVLNQTQLGTAYLSVPEDPRVEPMFVGAFAQHAYSGHIVAVGVREVDSG